jgi:4-methylaminobutanoate oxidase (formaldehyde-forming)
VFGSKAGWERPNWFAPAGVEPVDRPSYGRANWFPHVAAEHKAIRERVALIDQSSFAKFEIAGKGALDALQRLAVSDMEKAPGRAIYTQLLNERAGIEADLTITRLAEDRFYVVTGSGFGVHDMHWIRSHLPADGSVSVQDVTSARAVINICGPKAREVLQNVADADVSNAAHPFATCRTITIGACPDVRAIRIGYVGELGWELHLPQEYAAHVYGLLRRAGEEFGIADAGYRAIDTLRVEKFYLYWSSDITPDYNPLEAGLEFRIAWKKPDFVGREALLRVRDAGLRRRLAIFTLERDAPIFGGEAVLHAGKVVSVTTSGNVGHTIGKPIAYAYLPIELANEREFEIESFCERYPARRHDGALYDPENRRLKS